MNLSIVFTYGHEQGNSESRGLENPGPKWRDIILVMKQEVDSQGITEEVPVDVLYDFFSKLSRVNISRVNCRTCPPREESSYITILTYAT